MMKNLFILIAGILLLAGCSHPTDLGENINNSGALSDDPALVISAGLDQSGSIIHIPIEATGSMEVYSDSLVFNIFKQNSKCSPGGMADGSLYCEGTSGYNHLYKIPLLRLEYIYDSWTFNYKDQSYQRMLTATGGTNPIVLSGNMMYQVGQNKNYPIEDPVMLLKKKISDSSQDVIDDLTSKGCEISLITGNDFTGYVQYFIPVFKDPNINNYTGSSNLCVTEFPVNLQSSYWRFVFSPESKDYYYVIGDPGAGSAPARYDSKSLKLFVE